MKGFEISIFSLNERKNKMSHITLRNKINEFITYHVPEYSIKAGFYPDFVFPYDSWYLTCMLQSGYLDLVSIAFKYYKHKIGSSIIRNIIKNDGHDIIRFLQVNGVEINWSIVSDHFVKNEKYDEPLVRINVIRTVERSPKNDKRVCPLRY